MTQPFIRNHQYNFIKNQVEILQRACRTVNDLKIVESIQYDTLSKINELFTAATESQKKMLDEVSGCKTTEDFQRYLRSLEPYMLEFPTITEKQIKKLFPKNKKLKIPNLSAIDFRYVTYLSWIDIGTNKLFIVYELNGQFIGIEGRNNPTNKAGYCFLCNKSGEVSLFSAISKSRPAHSLPDYYKAIGNYMCSNSHECNKNITDQTSIERFIQNVVN